MKKIMAAMVRNYRRVEQGMADHKISGWLMFFCSTFLLGYSILPYREPLELNLKKFPF